MIDFLGLRAVADVPAANLSGGQKKLLELGRTMMVDAKVVLLDEVGAGVNRALLGHLTDNIRRMNRELGYTFFIIEHDMQLISSLCATVIVMANGSVMAEGAFLRAAREPGDRRGLFRRRDGRSDVSLVELRSVVAGYGGAPILHGVDIAIDQSDIGVIIGPNGAGKSTALKAIFGLVTVSDGSIHFGDTDITNYRPDRLVPMGLSYVPQVKNVFTSLTVHENLEMGAFTRQDDIAASLDAIYEMFPRL